MTVTAVAPEGRALPLQVVIAPGTVPVGAEWTLTGATDRTTWRVRGGEGTSTGEQVVLVDAAAPVGLPTTYTLSWVGPSSGRERSAPVARRSAGDMVTDLSGAVSALGVLSGDDSWSLDPRVELVTVQGRRAPVPVLGGVVSSRSGTSSYLTGADGTRRMQAVVEASPLVYLHHDVAACTLPDCDVPACRLVVLTGVSQQLTANVGEAEREWDLQWTEVDDPEPGYVATLSPWDAFDAQGVTWDAFDALGLSWDEMDATVWVEG